MERRCSEVFAAIGEKDQLTSVCMKVVKLSMHPKFPANIGKQGFKKAWRKRSQILVRAFEAVKNQLNENSVKAQTSSQNALKL